MGYTVKIEKEGKMVEKVHVDTDSLNEIINGLNLAENIDRSNVGRKNRVKEAYENIKEKTDNKMYVFACKRFMEFKREYSHQSVYKLKKKLKEDNIEFNEDQKIEAKNLIKRDADDL